MQKIIVKVCVCSNCVMAGAIDIISSIESLKKIKTPLGYSIKITPTSCPKNLSHDLNSPVVWVNDDMMENATTQTVMAKILADQQA